MLSDLALLSRLLIYTIHSEGTCKFDGKSNCRMLSSLLENVEIQTMKDY